MRWIFRPTRWPLVYSLSWSGTVDVQRFTFISCRNWLFGVDKKQLLSNIFVKWATFGQLLKIFGATFESYPSNLCKSLVPTLLDPTLLDRLAAHVGWCLSNNFCSIKCWIEFACGQTFRPTILVDKKLLECFAALPTKLYSQEGHARPPNQSRIKA